jgi:ubiquinol-cytochrome c reductase cytochrome c1 subunit
MPSRNPKADERAPENTIMIKRTLLIAAAVVGFSAPALAAEAPVPPQLKWSFHGPFGTFDRAQLQRG